MKLSQDGLNLIKQFEGCKLVAYRDCVDVLTIGYGHTGPDVCEDSEWSQNEADECLELEAGKFATGVNLLLKTEVTQGQFDALVSFAYNLGLNALATSTLLALTNQCNKILAAAEFFKWNHAGGKVVAGLTDRRAAERERYLS